MYGVWRVDGRTHVWLPLSESWAAGSLVFLVVARTRDEACAIADGYAEAQGHIWDTRPILASWQPHEAGVLMVQEMPERMSLASPGSCARRSAWP